MTELSNYLNSWNCEFCGTIQNGDGILCCQDFHDKVLGRECVNKNIKNDSAEGATTDNEFNEYVDNIIAGHIGKRGGEENQQELDFYTGQKLNSKEKQLDFSNYGNHPKINLNEQGVKISSLDFTYANKRYRISFNYIISTKEANEEQKYARKFISSLVLKKLSEKANSGFKGGRSPFIYGTEKIPDLEAFIKKSIKDYHKLSS